MVALTLALYVSLGIARALYIRSLGLEIQDPRDFLWEVIVGPAEMVRDALEAAWRWLVRL